MHMHMHMHTAARIHDVYTCIWKDTHDKLISVMATNHSDVPVDPW